MVSIAAMPDGPATLAGLHRKHGTNMFGVLTDAGGIGHEQMLRTRVVPSYGSTPPQEAPVASPGQVTWTVDAAGKGLYQAVGSKAQAYAGHAGRFESATAGRIRVTAPEFVALTITPLDGDRRILVTACGRCENTDMEFSRDRRTVGRNWGRAPVRIEAVRGTVVLPEGRWTCQAVAPDGSPGRPVPITNADGRAVLAMSPGYETMWYVLERHAE